MKHKSSPHDNIVCVFEHSINISWMGKLSFECTHTCWKMAGATKQKTPEEKRNKKREKKKSHVMRSGRQLRRAVFSCVMWSCDRFLFGLLNPCNFCTLSVQHSRQQVDRLNRWDQPKHTGASRKSFSFFLLTSLPCSLTHRVCVSRNTRAYAFILFHKHSPSTFLHFCRKLMFISLFVRVVCSVCSSSIYCFAFVSFWGLYRLFRLLILIFFLSFPSEIFSIEHFKMPRKHWHKANYE